MPLSRTCAFLVGGMAVCALGCSRAADRRALTDGEKPFYAVGIMLSRQLAAFDLSAEELALVKDGLDDGLAGGRPRRANPDELQPEIQALRTRRQTSGLEAEKRRGLAYVEKALRAPGARRLDSGAVFIEEVAGAGNAPAATDRVTVNYRGTCVDGTEFDSSADRGEPVNFPLDGVIRCWTDGLQLMHTGGKARLVCPSEVAYGDAGMPPRIRPGATLDFEIELLEVEKMPN